MKYIQGQDCFFLNSEDMHDPDIALTKTGDLGQQLLEGCSVVTHQIVGCCSPGLESLVINFEE